MRILVVDDDAMAAELAGAVIEDMGHEAILAADGVQARGVLDTDPAIDVVISDMYMPGLNGLELFRALRDAGCNLPFILLSGDDPEKFLESEPTLTACLLKDFTLEETLPEALGNVREAGADA